MFLMFDQLQLALRANPMRRFLAQNCFGNTSIIRGLRSLSYHVCNQGDGPKTPLCTKIQKLKKKMSLLLAETLMLEIYSNTPKTREAL